jgi:hypothetical protein
MAAADQRWALRLSFSSGRLLNPIRHKACVGDQSLVGSYFREPRTQLFEGLETLVMTLSPELAERYENLAINLEAATNVRNLSLRLPEQGDYKSLVHAMLRFSPETNETRWSRLRSLSLDSMPPAAEVLVDVVKSNAATLRHLYLRDCTLRLLHVKQSAQVPDLDLVSFQVDDFEDHHGCFPENTAFPFVNKHGIHDRSLDFLQIASKLRAHDNSIFAIEISRVDGHPAQIPGDMEYDTCTNTSSEDSVAHRLRTGPKWVWGRYYNDHDMPTIYYYQVPDSNRQGRQTSCWKFTSRDGRVAFGTDPLAWFDDWDTEAGDVEEPTPHCNKLRKFARRDIVVRDILGEASTAWETLRCLAPPEGAVQYDAEEGTEVEENWTLT